LLPLNVPSLTGGTIRLQVMDLTIFVALEDLKQANATLMAVTALRCAHVGVSTTRHILKHQLLRLLAVWTHTDDIRQTGHPGSCYIAVQAVICECVVTTSAGSTLTHNDWADQLLLVRFVVWLWMMWGLLLLTILSR